MPFIHFLWRLVRRRWLRRVLLWLVVRLVRRSGWRQTAKFVFRSRRHWGGLAAGAWRATLLLLRFGVRAIRLIGWVRAHGPRALGHRGRRSLAGTRRVPRLRPSAHRHPSRNGRMSLGGRVAQRRDSMRRSILAAVGVDPDWRPRREPRAQLRDGRSR